MSNFHEFRLLVGSHASLHFGFILRKKQTVWALQVGNNCCRFSKGRHGPMPHKYTVMLVDTHRALIPQYLTFSLWQVLLILSEVTGISSVQASGGWLLLAVQPMIYRFHSLPLCAVSPDNFDELWGYKTFHPGLRKYCRGPIPGRNYAYDCYVKEWSSLVMAFLCNATKQAQF